MVPVTILIWAKDNCAAVRSRAQVMIYLNVFIISSFLPFHIYHATDKAVHFPLLFTNAKGLPMFGFATFWQVVAFVAMMVPSAHLRRSFMYPLLIALEKVILWVTTQPSKLPSAFPGGKANVQA